MSLFNHFICASSNVAVLMLEAYENKKQAQKIKYFDINKITVNPSIYRSKFLW